MSRSDDTLRSPARRRLVLCAAAAGLTGPAAEAGPGTAEGMLLADDRGFPARSQPWLLHVGKTAGPTPDLVAVPAVSPTMDPVPLSPVLGPIHDPDTGLILTRLAPPKSLAPGEYRILEGGTPKARLSISDGRSEPDLSAALRGFYLQRCGGALNDPLSGVRHRPCHGDDALLDGGRGAAGGWHSGASYDKSVRETALCIGLILGAFADHPARFPDGQCLFPESGNGRPDALDEMTVGLTWLMTLQDADGRVAEGVAGTPPARDVMPQDDIGERRLLPRGPAPTALAAAALLLAARVYAAVDPDLAGRFGRAGALSLGALETDIRAHPEHVTAQAWSARVWALAEAALLSGERADHLAFAEAWGGRAFVPPAREDTAGFAVLSALTAPGADPLDSRARLRRAVRSWAEDAAATARYSPYGLSLTRFYAGTNRRVAIYGSCLAFAAAQGRDDDAQTRAWTTAAIDHLHFLRGRNPLGQCYITGPGRIERAAHPMARGASRLLPGFLVAGPADEAQDGVTPTGRGAASHTDRYEALESNAPCLIATAGLVALIARLSGSL